MEYIIRNGLHFTQLPDGGYTCAELAMLPKAFLAQWDEQKVHAAINGYLSQLRACYYVREEGTKGDPTADMWAKGAAIFDEVRTSVSTEGMNLFQQFLFWLSDWDFYHPLLCAQAFKGRERAHEVMEHKSNIAREFLLPALPEAVRQSVQGMELLSLAVDFGHFAIMFCEGTSKARCIVTDSQLISLDGVYGYVYLDITPDGKPIARSICDRGGQRAFFDGVRLMSHDRFRTCAPKTVIIDTGYKVNSTQCTIVNGMLFDLIDMDDKVAHTTGAFLGLMGFSRAQQAASFHMAEASGARMRATDGTVVLDGKPLKPLGHFAPSPVALLDSGFSFYHWSTYTENVACHYDHVLAVDDNPGWLDKLQNQLGREISKLETFQTGNGEEALSKILEVRPDAVLLDMHLTPDERFEGLWITNQLLAADFKGAIMITSGYPKPALVAMAALIKGKGVKIPGKDIDRIRLALRGKPID